MTRVIALKCLRRGHDLPPDDVVTGCPRCRDDGHAVNLSPVYDPSGRRMVLSAGRFDPDERGVWRYHALLPVDLAHAVWLGEGETPLVHATALGARLGLDALYLKNEARNPTGYYKVRMEAVLVARAPQEGARDINSANN